MAEGLLDQPNVADLGRQPVGEGVRLGRCLPPLLQRSAMPFGDHIALRLSQVFGEELVKL